MAATDVIGLGGLVTYQGSGFATLDGTIIETFNRDDIMPEHKQYMALMDFTDTALLSPNQTAAAKSAPKAMGNLTETGIPASAEFAFTPKKGFAQQEIGAKYSRSRLFTKWARQAKTLQGAPDAIQAELADVSSEMRDLALAYDIRYAEELVKVFANGFSGGSLTPKGKNLFDTHTWGVTGSAFTGTFANFTNGAITFDPNNSTDLSNGAARVQALIDQLKQAKDENGKLVKQMGPYKLYCSRVREVFWKAVLNNHSKFSGQGSNAMKENQFIFDGNIVEIVVLDLLGQVDYNNATIGGGNYIFITNSGALKASKSLKTYRLYPLTIDSWENMETGVLTTKGVGIVGADHFGCELFIAGSTCA